MVVEVTSLQVKVCVFPVEFTVVKHEAKVRSSGHRQSTFVEEPMTTCGAAGAEVELSGQATSPTFFLTDLISETPGTG